MFGQVGAGASCILPSPHVTYTVIKRILSMLALLYATSAWPLGQPTTTSQHWQEAVCIAAVFHAVAQAAHTRPTAPQHAHPDGVAAPFPVLAVADRFTSTRSSCFAADRDSMPGKAAAIFRNRACNVQTETSSVFKELQNNCGFVERTVCTRMHPSLPYPHLDVEASLSARLDEHDVELPRFGIPLLNGHLPAQVHQRGMSSSHSLV